MQSAPEIIEPAHIVAGMSQVVVANAYAVNLADLRQDRRGNRQVAFARHVAIYLAHIVFSVGFTALGNAFGRDRSTVIHAVRRIENMRGDDPRVDQTLNWLEALLRAAMETAQ